jgi:hypothetical protein
MESSSGNVINVMFWEMVSIKITKLQAKNRPANIQLFTIPAIYILSPKAAAKTSALFFLRQASHNTGVDSAFALDFFCAQAYSSSVAKALPQEAHLRSLNFLPQMERESSVSVYSMAFVGHTEAQLPQPIQSAEASPYGVEIFLATPRPTVEIAPVPMLAQAWVQRPQSTQDETRRFSSGLKIRILPFGTLGAVKRSFSSTP